MTEAISDDEQTVQLATARLIFQDARRFERQREQQSDDAYFRSAILALAVQPLALAAARSEQYAREQLAAQAQRNTAAARRRLDAIVNVRACEDV